MKKPLEKGKGKGAKSAKSKGQKWKGKGSFFEMSDAEKWWLEKFWSGRMRHLKDQPASKCRRIEANSFTIRGWGEWPVLQSTTTGMSGEQYFREVTMKNIKTLTFLSVRDSSPCIYSNCIENVSKSIVFSSLFQGFMKKAFQTIRFDTFSIKLL